jgi:hypothetical protein
LEQSKHGPVLKPKLDLDGALPHGHVGNTATDDGLDGRSNIDATESIESRETQPQPSSPQLVQAIQPLFDGEPIDGHPIREVHDCV